MFPTYREAKDAVWRDPNMLFSVIDRRTVEKTNESELIVYFKNGSYLQLIGADNPDRLRGAGPLGLVLDEYDFMKQEVWDTLEPIVRQNHGWAWFIGTPKGKGKLYDLYNYGQLKPGEAMKRGDQEMPYSPEWKSYLLKASESGIVEPKELQASKETMSQALYNQEWECEFLEGEGSVFRNVRDAAIAIPRQPLLNHNYVMGVDLAKVQDFTVVTIYDRANNSQVYQDRFQTIEYPFQKKRIIEIARHYNNAMLVLDATGLGDPVADDLIRAGLAVDPVKITSENKKEMIEKLSIWIEQRKVKIINMEETMKEFDNFSYEISRNGRITYNARLGYHDDIVMAHALAVWRLSDIYIEPEKEKIPLIRQEYLNRIKARTDSFDENDYEAI